MSTRTGLGSTVVTALEALEGQGAGATGEYVRSRDLLADLDDALEIGPRYAYPMVVDLAIPWRVHLPLFDMLGNLGSPGDFEPAEPEYTEVRLSPVGALALAAERGQIAPVPLGLIEGSLYRGSAVPPFDPHDIIDALRRGAPTAGRLPRPSLPTGGLIEGHVNVLLAGQPARLTLACEIVDEPGQLVITRVPLGSSPDEIMTNIAAHASMNRVDTPRRRADYLPAGTPERELPPKRVADLSDETRDSTRPRLVVVLTRDADPAEVRRWLRSIPPVTTEVDCALPKPMAQRLAHWDAGDGTGLDALADLLEAPPAR